MWNGLGWAGWVDGDSATARFNNLTNIAVGGDDSIYVNDSGNYRIRKITNGITTTLAGDGTAGNLLALGTSAKFGGLYSDLNIGRDGALYVPDSLNYDIKKITSDGTVTRIAGSDSSSSGSVDGQGMSARFSWVLLF